MNLLQRLLEFHTNHTVHHDCPETEKAIAVCRAIGDGRCLKVIEEVSTINTPGPSGSRGTLGGHVGSQGIWLDEEDPTHESVH